MACLNFTAQLLNFSSLVMATCKLLVKGIMPSSLTSNIHSFSSTDMWRKMLKRVCAHTQWLGKVGCVWHVWRCTSRDTADFGCKQWLFEFLLPPDGLQPVCSLWPLTFINKVFSRCIWIFSFFFFRSFSVNPGHCCDLKVLQPIWKPNNHLHHVQSHLEPLPSVPSVC